MSRPSLLLSSMTNFLDLLGKLTELFSSCFQLGMKLNKLNDCGAYLLT